METTENRANRWLKLAVYAAPVIGIISTLAPGFTKRSINKRIKKLGEFKGEVGGVHFSVFKPGVEVDDLILKVIEENEPLHFLKIGQARIVFDRRNLLRGKIVAEIVARDVSVIFFSEKTRIHERVKVKVQLPFLVKTFDIQDIKIQYVDELVTPSLELGAHSIYVSGEGLTNMHDNEELPAKIELRGNVYEGELFATIGLNLADEKPALDLNFELKNIDMVKLNDLFSSYGHFTVNHGDLSFYTEAAAKDGHFKGYVKPIINDLEMTPAKENTKGLVNKIWEDVLGVLVEIFENHKEKQLASKVPFEGTFKNPTVNVWYAMVEVLKNAFVNALKPSIDHEINIKSVEK
jgi:hypothetical protein